jgi:hypothetical protein
MELQNTMRSICRVGDVELTVCLPTPPGFRQMLQDGLGLILLDRFWHHVQDIMHYSGSELQVVVRLDTLFGDGFCNTFAISALELTGEQVTKPSFKKRHDTPHEEEPYTPSGSPDATARTFADRTSVEAVVY